VFLRQVILAARKELPFRAFPPVPTEVAQGSFFYCSLCLHQSTYIMVFFGIRWHLVFFFFSALPRAKCYTSFSFADLFSAWLVAVWRWFRRPTEFPSLPSSFTVQHFPLWSFFVKPIWFHLAVMLSGVPLFLPCGKNFGNPLVFPGRPQFQSRLTGFTTRRPPPPLVTCTALRLLVSL